MENKNGLYNSTKKRVLEIFSDQTWMDVPTVARKVGTHPIRRAYTYLLHLEEQNLIAGGHDSTGRLRYQITPRGLDRLQWFRAQTFSPIQDLIAVFLKTGTRT